MNLNDNSQNEKRNLSWHKSSDEDKNFQDICESLKSFLNTNADAAMVKIDNDFEIYYFKTLTDAHDILYEIKQRYFEKEFDFETYMASIAGKIHSEDMLNEIYDGSVVALYKGSMYTISGPQSKAGRSANTTLRESSLEGGLVGFVEQMGTNINLVRDLYQSPELEINFYRIGTLKTSKAAVLYNKKAVNWDDLNLITQKLKDIDMPVVQAANQLSQHIVKGQWVVPRMLTTERPDRVVKSLIKGKIIILLEGTPAVLIAPATFHDFMSSVDDHYVLPLPSFFLLFLRYLAILISLLFPASYVAFTSYNPEVYRVELALSIAGSRVNVPYPTFIEVIFMLTMMEFLIEASIRLPETIGQTAATVGGLILGQAATQAQLVSNIMIIIVAAVAISNFVIPVTSFGLMMRLAKYILLFFATIAGMYGMLIGMLGFIFYIFTLNSLSEPFFNPVGADFKKIFSRLKRGNF